MVQIKCSRKHCLYNADGECLNKDMSDKYNDSVYVLLDASEGYNCKEYER